MMGIKLCDRIATLLKADAHGVVESLEERSLLLKQYVREAEIALDQKRARFEALGEEEKHLQEALARRHEELGSLDEDVNLALDGGKEELARFAIRRLLPLQRAARALEAELRECAEAREALQERLEVQQEQLEALKARVRAELARQRESGDELGWLAEPAVADEEIELELLRRRTARAGGTS
jgi:phage shock protein A